MRQNPTLTRSGLIATVYRYSAMEFAAGFILSWTVPGKASCQLNLSTFDGLLLVRQPMVSLCGQQSLQWNRCQALVPGPLAALAAHFTNRFRICFAVACLAGVSPLDPRTVATVLAMCAGADGPAVQRTTLAAGERRSGPTTPYLTV